MRKFSLVENWYMLLGGLVFALAIGAFWIEGIRGSAHIILLIFSGASFFVGSHLTNLAKHFWKMAHVDTLTGSRNRQCLHRDWENLVRAIGDQRNEISVVMLDCDKFKPINDTYGHDIGDEVLKIVTKSLEDTLRGGDHLYRLGGDEFVATLLNTNAKEAEKVMARCREAICNLDMSYVGINGSLDISVGITQHKGNFDERTLSDLLREADIAMYASKKDTTRKVTIFDRDRTCLTE